MGGTDNKSSDPARRASMRTSMRLSAVPGQDEDYDLQAMGISDGFRPADVAQAHAPTSTSSNLAPSAAQTTPLRPSSISKPPAGPHDSLTLRHDGGMGPVDRSVPAGSSSDAAAQTKPLRPSSIAKPPGPHDSLTLRHDGGMGPVDRSVPAGSSSNAAAAAIPRPESPYQGPSGPSFPYQMYPQDVRAARTASIATTSTAPLAERSYNGPSGPTHPYQMYPQNTVPVGDGAGASTPAPIPVGFPGSADNYQRRIGPEGEDVADMIGPDGHTEQLPPYTRYPDEAYVRKVAGMEQSATARAESPTSGPSSSSSAVVAVPTAMTATTAMHAIPGAGGIGLATRDPEFASREDLQLNGANSPQSRQSLRSFQTDASHHDINTAAMGVVDEKKPLKKWQVLAKRKVWNVVPCWALGLTILILVMLAVVLGAILGTFFGKNKKPPPSNTTSAGSITYDSTPMTSMPAGIPPLTQGTYALPLMVTSAPATCFNDSTQAQAWNCNTIFSQQQISIKAVAGQPDISQYSVSLSYNKSFALDDNVYSYGMQPVAVQNAQLFLVTDVNEQGRGPAWAFVTTYNKTVIIPESLFPTPSGTRSSASPTAASKSRKNRRDPQFGSGPPPGPPPPGSPDFKRKGVAQEGEKPWICYWDDTILELFIYPKQNSSQNSLYPSDGGGGGGNATMGTPPAETSSATIASASSGQATSSSSTTSSSSPFETGMPPPSSYMMPFFNRVVKMEERRTTEDLSLAPFCRQYEIRSDGSPATATKDSSGNFIDVMIVENEHSSGGDGSKSRYVRRHVIDDYLNNGIKPRSDSGLTDCGCMWWAT